MLYDGGDIMTAGVHLYYVWYGHWAADAAVPILEDLGRAIGGTSYLDTVTSYTDHQNGTGTPVKNQVSLSGEVFLDSSSHGTSLSEDVPGQIVSELIASHQLPTDANAIYFVFTAPEITVENFGTMMCGFHGYIPYTDTSPTLKYAFVGNGRGIQSCIYPDTYAPNGDAAGDAMATVFAHELAETMTDPDTYSNGVIHWAWRDATGAEVGDKCQIDKGTPYQTSSGKFANIHLGNRDYEIQSLWLNGTNGMCVMANTAAARACTNGAKDGAETDVDCGGGACPPCLSGQHCATTADCADAQGICSNGTCAFVCTPNGTKDGTETDVDCGGGGGCALCAIGKTCARDADCSTETCRGGTCRCTVNADCPSGTHCSLGACVSSNPTCSDGTKNGTETDTDCGGGTCGACGVGKVCTVDLDCTTTTCRGGHCKCTTNADCAAGTHCSLGACMANATCSDGATDGAETDVDCGGGTCATCGVGKRCMGDTDCSTLTCRGNVCKCTTNADCPSNTHCSLGMCMANATCSDGVKNGAETDVDCGGGTCGTCGVGKVCAVDTDCTTVTCRGNVCKCTTNADCAAGQHCSLGMCLANATCSDGTKNGAEADVDCGGGTCGACGVGKACAIDTDCTTLTCRGNVCKCTTNADCAAGQHCSLGMCLN
jgi:hypothetical protein